MTAAVRARAAETPDEVALVDDSTHLTWAEFAAALPRVGGALLAAAGRPGLRVSVLGENTVTTLVTHAAALTVGVGTVATSRQLTAGELADQYRDAGVVCAVAGASGVAAVLEAGVASTVVVPGPVVPGGALTWDDWVAGAPPAPADAGQRPPQPLLVYTSGTTGRARGAEVRWTERTPGTAEEYIAAVTAESAFPPGSHLVVGPLQHNAPLTALRHLLAGQPVVVLGRFDAETVLQLIQRHRVTSSVMVPTHLQRLLALAPDVRGAYDVSSLRLVSQTGSACPPEVKQAVIDWFGPILTESYGGTETGTLCRIDSVEWLAHRGSVGRPRPPYEVVVLDDAHEPLAPGRVGILGFRAPDGRGPRYHADPEKTAKAFLRPGVFTLGDVGYVDDDGYVFVTDRIADMVVSGGVNLYPAESERVLATHPGVDQVAVIGVPHADLGEALLALVVPSGPAPAPSELETYARERLAPYKVPREYEFRADLDRNAMGKIDKRAMREPYWAEAVR